MPKTKKLLTTIGCIIGIMVILFTLHPPEVRSQTFTLKFSDPSPAGTPRTKAYAEWGDWLTQKTNGQIKIEWYWSESLAKAKDNIPATKGGICDMGMNAGLVYHRSLLPIFEFAELPFIGDGKEDWDPHGKAVMEMTRTVPELRKEIEKTGVKFIGGFGAHATHFMSKKPIRTLEDFKGLRVRAMGGVADFVAAAGGKSVPLTVYETYEGLQKGTVDASQAYMYYNIPSKFHEVTKYAILPGFQHITNTIWMNMQVYQSFPAEIRALFDEEAAVKLQELYTRYMDEDWDHSTSALKKAGIEFISIEPGEFAKWTELGAKAAHSKWLSKMDNIKVDGLKILKLYEELYRKYERKKSFS